MIKRGKSSCYIFCFCRAGLKRPARFSHYGRKIYRKTATHKGVGHQPIDPLAMGTTR